MFGMIFSESVPTEYRGWADTDHELYDAVAAGMMVLGAMPEPDSREPWFVCEAHAAGDTVVLARWWLTGVPEWQIGPVHPALVRQSGVDAAFIVSVLAWLLLTSASVAAFAAMQRWRTAGGRHV